MADGTKEESEKGKEKKPLGDVKANACRSGGFLVKRMGAKRWNPLFASDISIICVAEKFDARPVMPTLHDHDGMEWPDDLERLSEER